MQGQEEQRYSSFSPGKPASAVVMPTGPPLGSHLMHYLNALQASIKWVSPHCVENNLYTNSIHSTFWWLNLKLKMLYLKYTLRRPYGILFLSVPSSTSLEEVPIAQDWKENIDKVSFLHRINSQEKRKEITSCRFVRLDLNNSESSHFITHAHYGKIDMLLSSFHPAQPTQNCMILDCCKQLQVCCSGGAKSTSFTPQLPFLQYYCQNPASSTSGHLGMPFFALWPLTTVTCYLFCYLLNHIHL